MDNANQPSGLNVEASGNSEQILNTEDTSGVKNTVAYETHKKLLSEKKSMQVKLEEALSTINKSNEEKLQSEGKKDELLEAYKKRATDAEDKINNFAYTSVSKDVMLEAQKMGCINTTLLMKALDLSTLKNVNGDLSVDPDEVLTMLEATKKEYPLLFQKEAPVIHDGVVKKGEGNATYAQDLAACTTQKELDTVRKKHGRA